MTPLTPLGRVIAEAIDDYTEAAHSYVLGFEERNAMAMAIVDALKAARVSHTVDD